LNSYDTELTILHVEDDPTLVELVKATFTGFGFHGRMVSAGGVKEAIELLDTFARHREAVHLILVDMQLRDGIGLEVIREVKSDPSWKMIPVIALSSVIDPDVINSAYVLGANCYLPKNSRMKSPFQLLRTLYDGWLKDTLLPENPRRDRMQETLARAVHLRARTSDFFLNLATAFEDTPNELEFWLARSMNEGNMANLMAFFQKRSGDTDVSAEFVDKFTSMQAQIRNSLLLAEKRLQQTLRPTPAKACAWVLDLMEAVDEELFAEALGCLFPKGPAATIALKSRAATHLRELSRHILQCSTEIELCRRAERFAGWADRLAAMPDES